MSTSTVRRPGRFGLLSLGVASLCVGFTAWRSVAVPAPAAAPAPAPATIAVVRMSDVLDGLKEKTDREQQLKAQIDDFSKKLDEVNAQIKAVNEELDKLPKEPPHPDRITKQKQLFELTALVKARQQASTEIVAMSRTEGLRAMYIKIMDAIKAMASQNGYDLVLVDDSGVAIPPPPPAASEQSLSSYIATRKVAYASDKLDITKDVIRKMNNDHDMGK